MLKTNKSVATKSIPLAAFSGSLIDYPLREAMEMTARLGFDGIEIACRSPHLGLDTSLAEVRELGDLAAGHGLHIPALAGYTGHFSTLTDEECEAAMEESRKLFRFAEVLSVPYVRVFPGGPNAFLAEDQHYERAAHYLVRSSKEAAEHGVKLLLEIHNQTLVEDADSALRLLQLVGDAGIGFIHDAGNMYIADVDYGKTSVSKLGSHLSHIHVKDEKRIEQAGAEGSFSNRTRHGMESFMQCRLGEGEVDHRPMLTAVQESGYSGWITLECAAPFPSEERLAYDLAEMKRQLGNRCT
ncbi:sugar phosphate isomerase/epimerase [Paenibacillus sp. Marseille-Q4541]|uniref:sugar phosphate isomerase/epimerase family protein n=1 Tax=Paenibacillus sp. Marseille-Q4541 TaxID=2831522 RepID=UPI00201944B0|nr:sugar phosphate isomerase/epimerase [Paenibacillus sp. Marseille-Q4541]